MSKLPPNKMSKRQQTHSEREQYQRLALEGEAACNWPVRQVHENLRRFRESKGLNKGQMAAVMETTSRSYYTYEEGQRPIPSNALVKLGTFLGADLNQVLLGRSADPAGEAVDCIVDELFVVLQFLADEYADMDTETARAAARVVLKLDTRGISRLHPEMIRDAVRIVTRYRFHPEDLPAPPDEEAYGDEHDRYEADHSEWLRTVREDFGTSQENETAGKEKQS